MAAQPFDRRLERSSYPGSDWEGFSSLVRRIRIWVTIIAGLGVLLGIAAIVWPQATLLTIALLFGAWLLIAGLSRIAFAVSAKPLRTGLRWFIGLGGLLMLIAGVLLVTNPAATLGVLAVLIGAGWIIEGVVSMVTGIVEVGFTPRWWAVTSGIIGVIAGVTVLMLPGLALQAFVIVGGSLLIVIALATLSIAMQRPPISPRMPR